VLPDSGFDITAPSDPAISISPCDPVTHPAFKGLFEGPQFERLAMEAQTLSSYSLVLTNQSSERIMAMTVIWDFPHPGRAGPSRIILSTDAYYLPGNNAAAVIPPQTQVLVYPRRILPATFLASEHPLIVFSTSGLNGISDVEWLLRAPRVTVTFDLIVFEGGQVLGEDKSRIIEGIRNRKQAATDFVMLVRRARAEGLNIDTVLQKLAEAQAEHQSHDFWLGSFARMLQCGPRWGRALTLMQFQDLPHLPEFRRQQTV
jgi:hypothetical protein